MFPNKALGAIAALIALGVTLAAAQDPGWPRKRATDAGTLVAYQPQVDDWKDFTTLNWRQAFQLTPAGGKQVVGAATLTAHTAVDTVSHMVTLTGIQVTSTFFPSLDPAATEKMSHLLRSFVPTEDTISLERVVACTPKPQSTKTIELKNDPPFIFVSYSPAILLAIDGEPVLALVPDTKLKFVVNTHWALFQDEHSKYFLSAGSHWLTAADLHGPWSAATTLPKDFEKLSKDQQWSSLKGVIPPPKSTDPLPKVFYSTVPSEVILFNGPPQYAPIPKTQLQYATNTDSPLFFYAPKSEYYYLAAGRWFRSRDLQGKWAFASLDLPADFSKIPLSSPASAILASVPGTDQAKDSVLIAQIPTVMVIDPKTAAAQVKVTYTGNPQFAPIQGTSLQYATNTSDKVIKVGDVYYLCLQGVWFMSTSAQGPWTTATSVPQQIYQIPPNSPVYNVTYVTQTIQTDGYVSASYTSGYLGAFVTGAAIGAIVANGTGYYYPPYIGYPAYGYPVYHPYATPYGAWGYGAYYGGAYGTPYYNSRTGAYGVSQTAYGAYGSATRTASYNPYTGTYARSGSVSTAYGRQSVGQAYNPYTGTYAASHQGSSPTAQWGQSYVSNGNKSAYGQHYSTANGTVGSVQGSQGGKAYGSSSAWGNSAVGKTSSGDMYAGHDGNVYKNTGNGWEKYGGNGSWNSVQAPSRSSSEVPSSLSQSRENYSGASSSMNSLDQDRQSRMSGAEQSDRFQHQGSGGGSGGGGSWGGGHSWGGYGGGGRSWSGGGGGRSVGGRR